MATSALPIKSAAAPPLQRWMHGRAPAVAVAASFAAGIALDAVAAVEWISWLCAAMVVLVCWGAAFFTGAIG